MPRQTLIGLIAALAAALGLALGLMLNQAKTLTLNSGTLLDQPRALPAFTLTDMNGAPFGPDRLAGQWTLVFAGFTSCPDVCPTTLTLLKQVMAQLGADASRVQVLFLSVDPERDSPERLAAYTRSFDARFMAATAAEPQLAEFAKALGLIYVKVAGASPSTYTMDHSAALALINPSGQLAGYITPPLRATALSQDLLSLLKKKP